MIERKLHICPHDGTKVRLDTIHRGPWVCPTCKRHITREDSRLKVSL
jgi:ribosomal protein L37AE/L43A